MLLVIFVRWALKNLDEHFCSIVSFYCLSIAVGYLIGKQKKRPVAGVLWALFCGPFGAFLFIFADDTEEITRSRAAEALIRTQEKADVLKFQETLHHKKVTYDSARVEENFAVMRGDTLMGDFTAANIINLVNDRTLFDSDLYFDNALGEWKAIGIFPKRVRS